MKFVIEDSFWGVFPEARIGIIVGRGLKNTYKNQDFFESLLRASEKTAVERIGSGNLTEHPDVAIWREAFTKFKTKKGARSSIEALLKRVAGGTELRCINPLVDLYNSISLKYGLPCGGEDIDKFSGDLRLGAADGNEHFIPLGQEESSPPYPGEIVYKDDEGAVCRCWNWREAERTMLTESTKNAFLCIEIPDGSRQGQLEAAIDELAQHVIENLGGCCQYFVLDIENKTFNLGGDNE
jgi:DNA/RNA-binding domain of Phe-tRNA-synthetase-like protein